MVGAINPKSEWYLGDWLEDNRNVTYHYPEIILTRLLHGAEEITNALDKAATHEGTITHDDNFASLRFRFADEVVVQWLPDLESQRGVIEALRGTVATLARVAQRLRALT